MFEKERKELQKLSSTLQLTPARAADSWYQIRALRLLAKEFEDECKAVEKYLEQHIIDECSRQSATRFGGKLATATLGERKVAEIEDFGELERAVYKRKWLDLFQKRLSIEACSERWEAGAEIPGVQQIRLPRITLTGLKKGV